MIAQFQRVVKKRPNRQAVADSFARVGGVQPLVDDEALVCRELARAFNLLPGFDNRFSRWLEGAVCQILEAPVAILLLVSDYAQFHDQPLSPAQLHAGFELRSVSDAA